MSKPEKKKGWNKYVKGSQMLRLVSRARTRSTVEEKGKWEWQRLAPQPDTKELLYLFI